MVCNLIAPSSILPRNCSTHALWWSNLCICVPPFFSCQPHSPFSQQIANILNPPLLVPLRQLFNDIPTQTIAAVTCRAQLRHNTSNIWSSTRLVPHLHFVSFRRLKALNDLANLAQHCSPICCHSHEHPSVTCLQSACMINHCGSSPLPSLHFPSSFVHSILLQHFFFNWLAKHLTLAVRLGLHEIPPHPAYLLCVFFFLCQDKEFAPTCSRDCFDLRFSFVSNFPSCCTILAWEIAQLTPCSICDAMAQPVTSSNLRQTSTVPPEMPCLQNWNSHFGASRRLSGLATPFVRKLLFWNS